MSGRRPASLPGHATSACHQLRQAALITARLVRGGGDRPRRAAALRGGRPRRPARHRQVPARLVRERLRQIGEQVDLRDRLGAVRHSGLDGAAKADFDVRLVLDAQVQGALAVLLGRHERLLVLPTRLFRTTQSMTSQSSVMSTSAPERTRMLAGPTACGLRRGTPLERTPPLGSGDYVPDDAPEREFKPDGSYGTRSPAHPG